MKHRSGLGRREDSRRGGDEVPDVLSLKKYSLSLPEPLPALPQFPLLAYPLTISQLLQGLREGVAAASAAMAGAEDFVWPGADAQAGSKQRSPYQRMHSAALR